MDLFTLESSKKPIKFFTLEERMQIEEFLKQKVHPLEIAFRMNRHKGSIKNELKRRTVNGIYSGKAAHEQFIQGIARRGGGRTYNVTSKQLLVNIRKDYDAGFSITAIREKYRIGYKRFIRILKEMGIDYSKTSKDLRGAAYVRLQERVDALEELVKTILNIMEEK